MKNTRKAKLFKRNGKADLVATVWQQSISDNHGRPSSIECQRSFLMNIAITMFHSLPEKERVQLLLNAVLLHEEVTLDTI